MSNKIGFSNFRRFAKFPEIDLGDITILVGGNNSGKSTLVKALLLCVDNLRLMRMNDRRHDESKSVLSFSKPLFRFDANEFHDVKVKTFARAIHNKPVVDISEALRMRLFEVLNKDSKDGRKKGVKVLPSVIDFHFTLGQFEFKLVVSGDRDNKKNITTGDVESITIVDHKSNVRYNNSYTLNTMSFEILGDNKSLSLLQKLERDHRIAEKALEKANAEGDLDEITRQTAALDKIAIQIKSLSESELEGQVEQFDSDPNVQKFISQMENEEDTSLEGKINEMDNDPNVQKFIAEMEKGEDGGAIEDVNSTLRKALKKVVEPRASYDMPLGIYQDEVQEPVVLNVIKNILFFANLKEEAPKMKDGEDPDEYGARVQHYMLMEGYRESIKQEEGTINRSYRDLKKLLDTLNVEYISAHAANQNTLYNTADRNDYIAQTVHDFYREKIVSGEKEYRFIQEWMKQFEIGSSFDITSIDGEAYQVRITDTDGSSVPLADKGMGSIQMMILLLRLATIMRRNKKNNAEIGEVNLFDDNTSSLPTTVIIEEPEQNLHPKMQSLLADLFCYLTSEANLRFLIETHSEYLIRKSQVIVADHKFINEEILKKNNPFKVYYLPTDNKPCYELIYRTDGCFANDFGEGFFDEAEKLAFQVL